MSIATRLHRIVVREPAPSDRSGGAMARDFLLNAANGSATKLAEQLASPEAVLPWFLAALGAPGFLVGLLVPAKQAGSLLPQIGVAGIIRSFRRHKWFWVAAGAVQALLLAAMSFALVLPPAAAGWLIVALLVVFSAASGVGSVAFKEVLAKTIPKGERGRLLAARASIGGLFGLAAGVAIKLFFSAQAAPSRFLWLLLPAAALWAIGAALFALIDEPAGADRSGRSLVGTLARGWELVRRDRAFRSFLIARALLVSVILSVPFYAIHMRDHVSASLGGLGVLVVALGIARVLSSPVWGALADRSSKHAMAVAGALAAVAGVLALLVPHVSALGSSLYAYAAILFLVGLAQAGLRLGRKTYLVDAAPAEERSLYVAMSNTSIGLVVVAGSALTLVQTLVSLPALIGVFTMLAALGSIAALRLPAPSEW